MNHHESKPQREQQVTSLAGTFTRTPEEVFVGHRSSGAPVAPCLYKENNPKNPCPLLIIAENNSKESLRLQVHSNIVKHTKICACHSFTLQHRGTLQDL